LFESSALFISYDGLTDPLGGSQILPYLIGLQRAGYQITILSFEKPDRWSACGAAVREMLDREKIHWSPLRFTRRPRFLAKAWDLLRMHMLAAWLIKSRGIRIVHCRSYLAAQVGLFSKNVFGCKLLFDMRGFWVQERIDGGIWKPDSALDKLLLAYYVRVESRLFRGADAVVSLTRKAVPRVRHLCAREDTPIQVIPCCADFEHFTLQTPKQRASVRARLGWDASHLVVSYHGSLGTWYMLPEMLQFFALLLRIRPEARFLIVTGDWSEAQEELFKQPNLRDTRGSVRVVSATRDEVPELVGCSDVNLCFIHPLPSKAASSPTKLAEVLAMGIPVLAVSGVGDVDENVKLLQAGIVLSDASADSLKHATLSIDKLETSGGQTLRTRARAHLGLEVAIRDYVEIYRCLSETSPD
jgi:glycosyltransferase involved in cell wall biosynthesis